MAAYSSGKRTVLKTVRRETVRGFESYRCRHLVNKDARRISSRYRLIRPGNLTFLVSAVNSARGGPQGIARVERENRTNSSVKREGKIHGNMLSIFVEGSDPAASGKGKHTHKVGSVPTA